jgi:hypothetical protein
MQKFNVGRGSPGNTPSSVRFGLKARPESMNAGDVMSSKRLYLWHQAQVCMSLARVTEDPILKERYEDLALGFAQNAEREPDREISDLERSPIR